MALISFYTPWKQKTRGFVMFLGAIQRDWWHEMVLCVIPMVHTYFQCHSSLLILLQWVDTFQLPFDIFDLTPCITKKVTVKILSNCFTALKRYDAGLLRSARSGFGKRQYKCMWKMFSCRFSSGFKGLLTSMLI